MWNVFENVWVLISVAGIALVVVSMLRMDHPEWGRKPLLIPLALAALAIGLDAGFQTDTEAIRHIITAAKNAAGDNNAAGLMRWISPRYADRRHRSKEALESAMRGYLKKASIEKIKTQSHVITQLEDRSAVSDLKFVIHMNTDSQYAAAGSLLFVGMRFEFEKIGRDWRIVRSELLSVNNDPMSWNAVP